MKIKQFITPITQSLALLLCFGILTTRVSAATADDHDQEFAVEPGGTLSINSDAGAIEVNTWNQNNVRVRIENAEDFEVEFEHNGSDVSVRAEAERRGIFGFGRSNIRFNVSVPAIYNVNLDTGGGSITVAPLTGTVVADTSGGNIDIGSITGSINADTSGGHISIDDSEADVRADTSGGHITIGAIIGSVLADTSGGRITISSATGDVSADTSGGRIEIGNVGGDTIADTSGGSITMGEGTGSVRLETSGGSIRAGWAGGALSADTSGGNITLAGSDTSVEADTSGGNIQIDASNGPVNADTSGGSITIRSAVGPIHADTAGGRIDAELISSNISNDTTVKLATAGGDVTIRLPQNHGADIDANLEVSRRARGDYRIYTDFPLTINENDDGDIVGRGSINGGGDPIYLETTNSDIHIISVE